MKKRLKKYSPKPKISGRYRAHSKIMDKQWTTAISVKSKNPQTPIHRHLWECGVVTRTGIESQNGRFIASCDCTFLPILRNFEAIYKKRFFLFFSAFS